MSPSDCVFCQIVNRQLPAEVLYENDRVIAILDVNPIHYGHALVIPKMHAPDFLHVRETDLYDVLRVTQIVARAIVKALHLEGFNIFSNNGKVAGQSVFHFHLHVTPRYADDNITFVLQLKKYTQAAMADYGARIRSCIEESTSYDTRRTH